MESKQVNGFSPVWLRLDWSVIWGGVTNEPAEFASTNASQYGMPSRGGSKLYRWEKMLVSTMRERERLQVDREREEREATRYWSQGTGYPEKEKESIGLEWGADTRTSGTPSPGMDSLAKHNGEDSRQYRTESEREKQRIMCRQLLMVG